ncbi:hypothetical protein BP5796_06348 [Coleophoma crateriformis]|uniref:Uncharacterized protein n=1 Tax=Coleophoma crateriformis TaxID=565419 RepID=A0A3D8RWY0_9HELO|nr:hypothetical protein BP5796_06348 [Coleophoma crateriformis]
MPLITQFLPARERDVNSTTKDNISQNIDASEKDAARDYDDFDQFNEDECLDSDMEGSILHRPRPKKAQRTPAVPQRSDKRASRIRQDFESEMKQLEAGISAVDSDPHELYLSSEEDASESADDASLLSYDEEEDEENASRATSRSSSLSSQPDTARAVSFKFAGKPQVIDIFLHPHLPTRRSTAPAENRQSTMSSMSFTRPSPPQYSPSSNYRLSVCSSNSSSSSSLSHKLSLSNFRPSSRQSSKADIPSMAKPFSPSASSYVSRSTSFLASDPCPTPAPNESEPKPRTFLQRTFSAARRRPSMPKMNLSYTSGVVSQRQSSLGLSQTYREAEKGHQRTPTLEELRQEEAESMEREAQEGKGSYDSMLPPTVTQEAFPTAPLPTGTRTRAGSIMGLGRRKTFKGR